MEDEKDVTDIGPITDTTSKHLEKCDEKWDKNPMKPGYSNLSLIQQKTYFDLKEKQMTIEPKRVPLTEEENKKLRAIHPQVVKEQREYLKSLETFTKDNPIVYKLDSEISRYVKEMLTYLWEKPLKYARYYVPNDLIPIIPTVKEQTVFEHLQTLICMGRVLHLNLPSFKNARKLRRNYSRLSLTYPPKDIANNWLKMPISEDPNAKKIAAKYGANAVMSLESLKTIFASHEYCLENSWEIPVHVTENSGMTGELHKTVYFEEPFLKPNLTTFEKNTLYHKLALKEALLDKNNVNCVNLSNFYQLSNPPPIPNEPAREGSSLVQASTLEPDMLLDQLNDFSDQSSDSESGRLVITDSANNSELEIVEGDHEVTTGLPLLNVSNESELADVQSGSTIRRSARLIKKSLITDELPKSESTKGSSMDLSEKNPLDVIEKLQIKTFGAVRKEPTSDKIVEGLRMVEEPSSFVQPPSNCNVTYQMLKIGNAIILVQCSIDGVTALKAQKQNRFWQLATKLEYQPAHGSQALTYTELAEQWIQTAVVPGQSLARVRINAFNSEVIGVDELELNHVIPTQSSLKPSECISNTALILEKLSFLPIGNYILSHNEHEGSLRILKEIPESERSNCSKVYDLHAKYVTADATEWGPEPIPWIPIDASVLFFRHRREKRIPALFPAKATKEIFKRKKKWKKRGAKSGVSRCDFMNHTSQVDRKE